MQINRLEIRNFGSHESSVLDLRNRGLVLIEGENRDQGGSNGAGKSTIFESLCWGLFGATNSGLRGSDVIRVGSSSASVTVHLDVDGRQVSVTRTRDRRSSNLHLEIGGQDADGATGRETQAKLLRLLQLNWEAFVSVVMFPQGQAGLAAQSDGEQKHVLDTILTLSRFVQAKTKAGNLLKKMETELTDLKHKIKVKQERINVQNETIERLDIQEKHWLVERSQRARSLETQIENLENDPPLSSQPLVDQLAQAQTKLDAQKDESLAALDLYNQACFKLNQIRGSQFTVEQKIKVSLARITDIKILDPEERLAGNDTCPACDQQLPEEARQSLFQTYSADAHEAERRKQELIKEHSDLSAQDIELRQKIRELEQMVETLKDSIPSTDTLEQEIMELERRITRLNAVIFEYEQNKNRLKLELGKVKTSVSPYSKLIEDARQNRADAEREFSKLETAVEPLTGEIEYVRFWNEGFGNRGVKSLLMSTVTPFLNERANLYMRELSNDTAAITIKTQKKLKSGEFRDKMDFKVTYPGGSELYAGKSGGEQRRADISILFALGDLAASRALAPVHLRLLDEPFESLDALGCEQVVRLLRTHVLPRAKTILVMSHNESLKPLFEHRIKVVKENGVSRIEAA